MIGRRKILDTLTVCAVVLLLPILLLMIAPFLFVLSILWLFALIEIIALHLALWTLWPAKGKDVLVVTSNSPIWKEYIDKHMVSPLGDRAVVLNWSERKRWRWSLAGWAFRHFSGEKDFNPMAVVIRPFRNARVFRFHKLFRDYKHGKPSAERRLERELAALMAVLPERSGS